MYCVAPLRMLMPSRENIQWLPPNGLSGTIGLSGASIPAQEDSIYPHEQLSYAKHELAMHLISNQKRGSAQAALASFSILDVLDLDDRPSFIVDIMQPPLQHISLEFIHCNPSLVANPELMGRMRESYSPDALCAELHASFRCWLFGTAAEQKGRSGPGAYACNGHIWSAVTLGRHRVVSGLPDPPSRPSQRSSFGHGMNGEADSIIAADSRRRDKPTNFPAFVKGREPSLPADTALHALQLQGLSRTLTRYGPFDVTLNVPPENMSAHLEYFRSVDWAQTSIGPMQSWCPQLRCIVNMILNDSFPAVLFWGEDVAMIYNEQYTQIIGLLHPCMGQSARVAASEYWGFFQPLVDHINATGETLIERDMPIFLDRHGFLEETFFSFQFVPILDGNGHIAGYLQPLTETTKNKLLERRVSCLVEVGSQTAKARDLNTYWNLVLDTLTINDKDAPFALLYSSECETGVDPSSISSPDVPSELVCCILKGSVGVHAGHPIAQQTINVKDGNNIFSPYLVKAAKSTKPTLLHFEELGVPSSMLDGIQWKGYGDKCRCVIICPIQPTTSEQVQGFLILGVNPRRPFDAEYQQFVNVMSRLLATSLASVVLFDEEIRQKENAIGQASRIQEHLLAELQMKEKKFQRFAERADVAIFIMDPLGRYTYRNKCWYDTFVIVADESHAKGVWNKLVFPEDIAYCEGIFAKLLVEKTPISFELKTKMRFTPPDGILEPKQEDGDHFKWILCSAYPELSQAHELIEIVGSVTDISKHKWAEDVQKMRTKNAIQSKTHLEHFIDTTSHEMRNPLSAIMQCADGILSSYNLACPLPSPANYASLLNQTMDAAQTIAQCAQHMKHIIDDILTVSKIDSGLLVITPIDAQPECVARHAVKMFEGEAKAAGVDIALIVDKSYKNLDINWLSLDPTRLLQVLINLITNAIKFTRLEITRLVTVSIAASLAEPASTPGGIQFIDTKLVTPDQHLIDDWTQGDVLHLQFSVSDTGRGLSDEERSTLFARFSQASPRTHIHYGGSGLGLFISRRLTELQGGAIGLATQFRKGSTFSFYIKARRSIGATVRKKGFPDNFPEDMKHRTRMSKEIDRLLRPPQNSSLIRKQSAVLLDLQADNPSPAESATERLKRTNSASETLYVLIVEDNLVNQKVLAKQLRNLGCLITVANHGAEALEFLRKTKYWSQAEIKPTSIGLTEPQTYSRATPQRFDSFPEVPLDLSLILMDWEMPVMDGLTAVAKIRRLERDGKLSAHIPVIGVTANVREQQIQMAIDAGMDEVVAKPFRVTELLKQMRRVLAGAANKAKRMDLKQEDGH